MTGAGTTSTAATGGGYLASELDLLSLLETVLALRPRILKSGLPNLAFFRAANRALATPDDEAEGDGFTQVEFWLVIAREAGLTNETGSRLEVSNIADEFFARPPASRRELLRQAWLRSRELNEMALSTRLELPGLRRQSTFDVVCDSPGPDTLIEARHTLLGFVQELEGATQLSALVALVKGRARDFIVDHSDDGSWRNVHYRGIRERGGDEDIPREGNWELVEGALIHEIVALPMARLGYVELVGDDGAELIRPLDDPLDSVDFAFECVVQPNFEVLALGHLPDTTALWGLARMSRPAAENRVRRYVLERKPFTEALGRGHDAEDLIGSLASLSRSPLPQNVEFTLRDWSRATERIRIWPDALFIEGEGVEVKPSSLPAESQEACHQLPGQSVVCPSPKVGSLREKVADRRSLLDYSRPLSRAITPAGGLLLDAPHESLHLRARRLLEMIAKRRGADRYELDSGALKAAAAEIGPAELNRRINEALLKPLPPETALAVRNWTGEFNPPFAGHAEVALCDSPEQIALLEELPEFQRQVSSRIGPGAWLLRKGGAEALGGLLSKLGVKLAEAATGATRKLSLLLAMALLLAGCVVGPPTDHPGDAASDPAVDLVERLKEKPNDIESHANLLRIQMQRGDVEGARRTIEHLLKHNPDKYEAWLIVAQYHRWRGDLINCEKSLLKSMEIAPGRLEARVALASLYNSTFLEEEEIEQRLIVISLAEEADRSEFVLDYAFTLAEIHRFELAQAQITRILANETSTADARARALLLRSRIALRDGDDAAAAAALVEAYDTNPGELGILQSIARTVTAIGDASKLRPVFERTLEAEDRAEMRWSALWGLWMLALKEAHAAGQSLHKDAPEDYFLRVKKIDPTHPEVIARRYQTLAPSTEQIHIDEAKEALEALKTTPYRDPEAPADHAKMFELWRINDLYMLRAHNRCIEEINRAAQDDSRGSLKMLALFENRQFDEFLAAAEKENAKDSNPVTKDLRTLTLIRTGKAKQALTELEKEGQEETQRLLWFRTLATFHVYRNGGPKKESAGGESGASGGEKE